MLNTLNEIILFDENMAITFFRIRYPVDKIKSTICSLIMQHTFCTASVIQVNVLLDVNNQINIL